ncbi:MAG: 6-phosphogluconate dehydrogenase, decarboxylating [Amphiamblys sp. WSBS2006]|nr:MAG: 6-phosphogluconate dehydrogenase, decarboxylating [Amphiamblys sp. WSBS2006]
MSGKATFGLIGLATMGENLVLNMLDRGISVSVYNRTTEKTKEFVRKTKKENLCGSETIEGFCNSLASPRKILLMVQAGAGVESVLSKLLPLLDKNDVVIDGGNSNYADTERRVKQFQEAGVFFLGCGISGGEEGARNGPAMMPGGDRRGWPAVGDLLRSIAAQADGSPCCEWIGDGGSGHFVKTVHNAIEYAEMQLISETYFVMKNLLGISPVECSNVFEVWLSGELESYLLSITVKILRAGNGDLIEKIRDVARQKGTGHWFVVEAMGLGLATPTIAAAVSARHLSGMHAERKECSSLPKHPPGKTGEKEELLSTLKKAFCAARIVAHAEGFLVIQHTAKKHGWKLDYTAVCRVWKAGCIIRSALIKEIEAAYARNPDLGFLLADAGLKEKLEKNLPALRKTVGISTGHALPTPALSAALSFIDGLAARKLPTNLIQAQRDFFGAHTYELEGGEGVSVHTDWNVVS